MHEQRDKDWKACSLQLNFLNVRDMKWKLTVQITHNQTYSPIGKSPRHYSVPFSILHGYKMKYTLSQFASTPQQIDQHISTSSKRLIYTSMSLAAGYPKHLAECHHGSLAIRSPRHTRAFLMPSPKTEMKNGIRGNWHATLKWIIYSLDVPGTVPPTQYLSPPRLLHV